MAGAFIIVDMINDFVREDGALTCGERAREIIEPIRARLEQARSQGETVIFMCDNHRPDDPEFKQYPPHAVQGTEGAEVIEELAPLEGEYVLPKRRYSSFFQTQLLLVLLENDVDEVEIAGVCTNICVLYTATDANAYGFDVTVDASRVAAMTDRDHEIGLYQMKEVLGITVNGS